MEPEIVVATTTQPGKPSVITTDARATSDTCARIVDHAQSMYDAECNITSRLELRSRVIQSSAGLLLLLTGYALFRGSEMENMGPLFDMDSIPPRIQEVSPIPISTDTANWLALAIIALTLAPFVFGIIMIFASLANEFRHGVDSFFFNDSTTKDEFRDTPKPQRTWKQISILWGIGEAVDIGRQVLLPRDTAPDSKLKHETMRFGPSADIEDKQSSNWFMPRPRMSRYRTGSFYLQVKADQCLSLYRYLKKVSPTDAWLFRAKYTAAQSQCRWNQRRVDELRISERLLVQGIALGAISLVLFVNLSLQTINGYRAGLMLLIGIAFGVLAMLYKQTMSRRWSKRIDEKFGEMSKEIELESVYLGKTNRKK